MRGWLTAAWGAALFLFVSSADASSVTYTFSGTATASAGQFAGDANAAVSGTFTIDFGAGPQLVGGVIGSPSGWNSTTFGGDAYGKALPTSLILTATVNVGSYSYSTPAISDGGLLNGGVHSQLDATAGCNGTCGYAYTMDALHYYHDPSGSTFSNGQYFSSEGVVLSLASSTLNWGADGLPMVPGTGLAAALASPLVGSAAPLGTAYLTLTDGSVLNLNVTTLTGPVSAVPLPASAWFLSSGLLGLVCLGRRRRT